MEQAFNPYLPLAEHIPDGEPHVFNDRLYVFGSHDRSGGTAYCEQDYAVWSTPVTDLSDWRYEGESYRRTQDPSYQDGMTLFAPDVALGPDGRFYLYYCLSFNPEVGVAVSDRPEGPYEFCGHVHHPDGVRAGAPLAEGFVFDPAVLVDEDERVYLYYGFAPAGEKEGCVPSLTEEQLMELPAEQQQRFRSMPPLGECSWVVELERDMVTVKGQPRQLIPGEHCSAGTTFEGHGFFEASSCRRFGDVYYFVYSSHKSHELCYATSSRPDADFTFGGTLVSNGDIGFEGRTVPDYPLSNNHGSLVKVGVEYYVFYHRATEGTEFSRQGCAERVTLDEHGHIAQVQTTSCGLNGGPLLPMGAYPASIACHLTDPTVTYRIDYKDRSLETQIQVTEGHGSSFVTNISDGSVVGYRSFAFEGKFRFGIEVRGSFSGVVIASHDEEVRRAIGSKRLTKLGDHWRLITFKLSPRPGDLPLFLSFTGSGTLDLRTIAFLE